MKLYHFCNKQTLQTIRQVGFEDSLISLKLKNGPVNHRGVFFFDRVITPVFNDPSDWRFVIIEFPELATKEHLLSQKHCQSYGIFWPVWFIPADKVNRQLALVAPNGLEVVYG